MAQTFNQLAQARFVQLTTFRRTGESVPTPVWVASEDHTLLVTTPGDSGKVKRLRRDQRVELRTCDRLGRVAPGVDAASGRADIEASPDEIARLRQRFAAKYGWSYRVLSFLEQLARRGRPGHVILRIVLD